MAPKVKLPPEAPAPPAVDRLADLLAPRQLPGEDALACLTRILADYDQVRASAGRGFFS